jgi:hypothetical protein
MPRFSAILVVMALLAAPVSLVARGIFCDSAECEGAVICPMHMAGASQPIGGMAKHAPMCGTHQARHALDYGFIAPFAPAIPLAHAQIAVPAASHEFREENSQLLADGVSSAPFTPPRS